MHVTFRTTAAGPRWHCEEGKSIELPDEEAQALIAAGHAFQAPPPKARKPAAADEDETETASANAEGETAAENYGEKPAEKKPRSVMSKMKAAAKPAK